MVTARFTPAPSSLPTPPGAPRSAKADAPRPPLPPALRPARSNKRPPSPSIPTRCAQQTYSFRVSGPNRSLQKKVVFTGNLLTTTNLLLSLPATTNLTTRGFLGGGDRRDTYSYGASNLTTRRHPGQISKRHRSTRLPPPAQLPHLRQGSGRHRQRHRDHRPPRQPIILPPNRYEVME